jgi:antitoxin ParD1/3/4
MTMHINLSPEMEIYIKTKVGTGFYGNATEVIRDAIRRMQATEQQSVAFQPAVAKGDAELERGEGIEYSPDLVSTMAQTALQDMRTGKPIDPDVLP